jgi:hypothetical protein
MTGSMTRCLSCLLPIIHAEMLRRAVGAIKVAVQPMVVRLRPTAFHSSFRLDAVIVLEVDATDSYSSSL